MKFKKVILLMLVFGLLVGILAGCGGVKQEQPKDSSEGTASEKKEPVYLSFAGGPASGAFGKAAAGIAVVLKEQSGGMINATTQATSGGGENVTLVGTGATNMGLAGSADLHDAYLGEGAWTGKKQEDIRLIGLGTMAVVNFVTLADSGIETLEDLNGTKFSVGSPGSASQGFFDRFAPMVGIKVGQVSYLAGGEAATALKDGQIDAYNWAPSSPATDVVDIASTTKIRLLDVGTKAQEVGFYEKYPFYMPATTKAGTYNGVDYDVPTIKTGIFWFANKNLPEDIVYEMTKAAYQNTEKLKAAFGPLKVMLPDASSLEGADIPLHPGAQKFWEEIGVEIPEAAKAK